VDRTRCLGNAVVPQVAEWIGHRILEIEHGPKELLG
jgi:site-specific DNA-cytosine methylase